MRSLLMISGSDADRLDRRADVIVLELAGPSDDVCRFFRDRPSTQGRDGDGPKLFVRVGALGTGLVDDELDRIMPARPDGIVLEDARGGGDLSRLGAMLAVREAQWGLADGAMRIIAMVCSAKGVLGLPSMPGVSTRLAGIGWDARALAADIGSQPAENGAVPEPLRTLRAMVPIAAAAAAVVAIDTPHPGAGAGSLQDACRRSKRDGFAAKLALGPEQVPIINAAFGAPD